MSGCTRAAGAPVRLPENGSTRPRLSSSKYLTRFPERVPFFVPTSTVRTERGRQRR